MHVISRKKLKEAAKRHADLEGPLDAWFRVAKKAAWKSLADVRRTFATGDGVRKWTIVDIKGNQYRRIVEVNCMFGGIYIRHVLTHADFDP